MVNDYRVRLEEKYRPVIEAIKKLDPDSVLDVLSGEAKPEDLIRADEKQLKLKADLRYLDKKYKALLDINDNLNLRMDTIMQIKEPVDPIEFEPFNYTKSYKGKNEACAIVGLSDWHVEERVDSDTVNGLNEYNPQIAEERAVKVFKRALKLVYKERQEVKIDKLLIWLGGDFISGYIHQELEESNYMSPIEATRFAKKLLISGIKYLADNGKFKEIIVQCNHGNHGRTDIKKKISTSHMNSYEYLMYQDIADYFELSGYKNITFNICKGVSGYVKIFDKTIRTMHGDNVRFGGGIGGISVPIIKALHRRNQQIFADMTIMGHFHQLINPTSDCMLNGSLIGASNYGMACGFANERPQQLFRILDKERGYTTYSPILAD